MKLNERQRRFVQEYLLDLNGTQAAIRAGYSARNAYQIGSALLARPDIAAMVEQAKAERAASRQVSADRVIEELARMAFADIRNFMDWGPGGITLRDKATLSREESAAIADLEPKPRKSNGDGNGNGAVGRLKLYDKLAALNALARHLGMIGSKTPLGQGDTSRNARDARKILIERLERIAKGEEGE